MTKKKHFIYVAKCGNHCGNLYFSNMSKAIAGVYWQAKATGTDIVSHQKTVNRAVFSNSEGHVKFDAGVWRYEINQFDPVIERLNFLN
jgi:hypothetical protein